LGERAGLLRNAKLIKLGADLCIVVHRNLSASVNAKDCAAQAIAAGIPTYLIESDEAVRSSWKQETQGRLSAGVSVSAGASRLRLTSTTGSLPL
jgi:4-hydroxy-3-methylbut-2-enyl diphosphate reductase IspH